MSVFTMKTKDPDTNLRETHGKENMIYSLRIAKKHSFSMINTTFLTKLSLVRIIFLTESQRQALLPVVLYNKSKVLVWPANLTTPLFRGTNIE